MGAADRVARAGGASKLSAFSPSPPGDKASSEQRSPLAPQAQAVTLNLSVSPGWIQKCKELLGGPSTPKACEAHLTQHAVLIPSSQFLKSHLPSTPHRGPLHSDIYSDHLPLSL